MPRLNNKHQALMGIGNGIVSLDGAVVDTNSGGAKWAGDDAFIYQKLVNPNTPNEKASIRLVRDGNNTEFDAAGGAPLFAAKDIYAAFLTQTGVRLLPNGEFFPTFGPGDGCLNAGHLLAIEEYQPNSNGIVDIMTGQVYDIKGINSLRAYDSYFVVRQGNAIRIFEYDGSEILGVKSLAPGTASCKVGQQIMLLYNFGKYLVFHPYDSLMGRVITANDSAFNPDVVDNGTSICIAYSLGASEYPGELVKLDEAAILAIPIVDLTKLGQVVVPPVEPPVPPPSTGLKKPEVSVVSWTLDELKNGREFNFIDRMNPGFGARVWVENGSMFASLSNPIGTGSTGMARLVKACPTNPQPPIPVPVPPIPAPSISKVRVDNLVLKNEDDSIFPYRGVSAFLLLRRLLEGDVAGVKSYCSYWSSLGYNVLRVFSQVDWTGQPGPGFYPADYPNYDEKVGELLDIARSYNLHVELVAHTFAYDESQMANHVVRLHNIIRNHNNVFLELANEPPRNGIDIAELYADVKDLGFTYPWATGQYDPTALPAGSYVTAHTPRDDEWPRKAKNLLEYRQGGGPEAPTDPAMNCPIIGDEPIGAGEIDIPGRRSTNKLDFYTYGALAQLYGAGSTFHYEDGLNALLPGPVQAECAKFMSLGMRAVWTDAQLGQYTRVGLGSSPIEEDDSLRTYGMILGALSIFVRVRPNVPLPTKIKDGWRITSVDQYGIVITLSQL